VDDVDQDDIVPTSALAGDPEVVAVDGDDAALGQAVERVGDGRARCILEDRVLVGGRRLEAEAEVERWVEGCGTQTDRPVSDDLVVTIDTIAGRGAAELDAVGRVAIKGDRTGGECVRPGRGERVPPVSTTLPTVPLPSRVAPVLTSISGLELLSASTSRVPPFTSVVL
jgi:hypothetical protein